MKKITMLLAACLMTIAASAQMTFTLRSGVTATSATNPVDGSTTLTVPAGTDLSGLITAVQIDEAAVNASQITPNPTTTKIDYGQLEVFTYNNKAYGFRFVEDVWFCAVVFSDPHTVNSNGSGEMSVEDLTTMTNNIIAMGNNGVAKVNFTGVDGLPSGFIPKTSIVFCLGDVDNDKGDDGSNGKHTRFLGATATLYQNNNIPFIFIGGNHDLSPDYWGSSNSDKGVTYGSSGGSHADDATISAIKSNNNDCNSLGVFDENITYFTGGSGDFQPSHFTFKFNDVRFYCANGYWFQKPYAKPTLFNQSPTYYAPDGIISALNTFVESHTSEASVWMQHYPFVAGTDCNRWWLDQNAGGYYIPASNSSNYGSSTPDIPYNDSSANTLKKDPLATIMMKTAGKVDDQVQHFSGHTHSFADNTYDSKIRDYTVAEASTSGNNAYVVLLKKGEGVKAVLPANFH